MKLIRKYNINSYDELLNLLIGKIKTKNVDIKMILNLIINAFLVVTFFVMCAGITSYFKQELGINAIIPSIFFPILCFFFLNKNTKGVVLLNFILIPIMILIIIILGIKAFETTFEIKEVASSSRWMIDSVLYASYNSITLVSILIPIKKYIKDKKDIIKIAVACFLIIIMLSSVIFILLLSINTDVGKIDFPTAYAAGTFGIMYKYLYGIIILGAITTTAISSAYGFLNNISESQRKYKLYNIVICFCGIAVSNIGFSNLVNSLYPIFGIFGIMQLIFILKCK